MWIRTVGSKVLENQIRRYTVGTKVLAGRIRKYTVGSKVCVGRHPGKFTENSTFFAENSTFLALWTSRCFGHCGFQGSGFVDP